MRILAAYFILKYLSHSEHRQIAEIIFNGLEEAKAKLIDLFSYISGKKYKSSKEYQFEVISGIDFSSEMLVGLETQKAELFDIIEYLVEPEKYAKRGTLIEKGILLTGFSRTGKTLLARALVGELNKLFKKEGFCMRPI